MIAAHRQTGRGARILGGRLVAAFAVLVFSLATVSVPNGPAVHASSVHTMAQATSCPIAGQCKVNPKTGCPTLGPLQPTPPLKCVAIPAKTFYVSKTVSSGGNTGCQSEIIVQVPIPANSDQYEAVVYANIGAGTRWWSTPDPGGQPGHTIANGAAVYRVPTGYHAWQVAGGVSWGVQCSSTFPTKIWAGDGAWKVVTPSIAGSGTISIHGPTKNKFHSNFNERIAGTASGGANYVIAGEQLNPAGGCASTVAGESAKGSLDWLQWPTGNGPVHGHFSLVAKFYASNHGKHGMCAYLVNKTTNQVYARASRWWTNSGGPKPVVGRGTIGIQGPTQNKLGANFNETVSGTAGGGANDVISGEQRDPTGGCAAAYTTEAAKSDWHQWPTGTGTVSGHFSLVARFGAVNPGTHGMCSYLINRTSKQTYAHASQWWTNA